MAWTETVLQKRVSYSDVQLINALDKCVQPPKTLVLLRLNDLGAIVRHRSIPVWKFDLCQCRWKSFPILSCCTTGVDVISQKILKKLVICEEVVEEDMMILPLQLSSQRLHNSHSKVVLGCVTLLPSIYFKPREVAIVTICKDPYLDAPLRWLERHILFQWRPPLKFYHSLINSNNPVDFIEAFELLG